MRVGELNYGRFLRLSAERYAAAPFLWFEGRSWTYGQFNEEVNRVANRLTAEGVRPGERVAIRSYNTDRTLLLMFASAKIGCAVIPLSTMVTDDDVVSSLTVSEPSVVALGPGYADSVGTLRAVCGARLWLALEDEASGDEGTAGGDRETYAADGAVGGTAPAAQPLMSWSELVRDGDSAEPGVTVPDDDLATVLFTSGSTGTPKGTMKSFANLAWGAINRQLAEPRARSSVELYAIPLAGIGFSNFIITDVLAGAQLVLMRKFDPAAALELIQRHAVTNTFLAPTMISAILREGPSRAALASVLALETAYEITPDQRRAASEAFTSARIMYGYGMTEGSMSRTPPERFLEGGPGVGFPSGIDEYRIMGEGGVLAGPGEVGEIEIAGPTTMMGYLGRPDDETITKDGWVRSGDLGRFAPDGTLEFLGRRKDMIKTGGYNVFAAEVERALVAAPEIESAAVIGVQHDYWGEAVVAVVTLTHPDDSLDRDKLRQHLSTRLATFMLPKEYVVVGSLPLNPGGKVAKGELLNSYRDLFAK